MPGFYSERNTFQYKFCVGAVSKFNIFKVDFAGSWPLVRRLNRVKVLLLDHVFEIEDFLDFFEFETNVTFEPAYLSDFGIETLKLVY